MCISVITSLFKCERYLYGYFNALARISNLVDVEVMLLHNEPSVNEIKMIEKYINDFGKDVIKHILIKERESLYKTWNRGIQLSSGFYIAIWNVDDIRIENSLERQKKVLEENPEIGITYGDIIEINRYGDEIGTYHSYPEFSKKEANKFLRSYLGGCFPMWKKSVHTSAGYFDEQFKSGGDFDFFIRVARNSTLKKTKGLLGYYLNENKGLSTTGWLQPVERTVIELRYAQFDKVNYLYLLRAIRNYKIFTIDEGNITKKIREVFPNYTFFYLKRLPLFIIGVVKYPFTFIVWNLIKIIVQSITKGPEKTTMKIKKFFKTIQ